MGAILGGAVESDKPLMNAGLDSLGAWSCARHTGLAMTVGCCAEGRRRSRDALLLHNLVVLVSLVVVAQTVPHAVIDEYRNVVLHQIVVLLALREGRSRKRVHQTRRSEHGRG